MAEALVIVESPAKARTINKYLGKKYKVMASAGHVRDLPKGKLGVDEEHGFKPTYQIIPTRKKVVADLKVAAKKADAVYLAADPDREGEAICWHLAEALGTAKGRLKRVTFNEITKRAIEEAFEHPREIDVQKVDAQQARRILDRLVGYKISPLLWKKVQNNLSAGRVQSVALRIVCDREREIQAFKSEEYWSLTAHVRAHNPPPFDAKLSKDGDKKIAIHSKDEADAILARLKGQPFVVAAIEKKEKRRNPPPPFITSTLQQDAARRLRFSVKKTMMLAQRLYEGLDIGAEGPVGLITYMRTDSFRIADVALAQARETIGARFGASYVPEKPRFYKSKKGAQDAHEAIRPTDAARRPDDLAAYLERDLLNLYRLIYERFLASQMESAVFDVTEVDIAAAGLTFRANGSVPKFDGFLALYRDVAKPAPAAKAEGEEASESEAEAPKEGEAESGTDGVLPEMTVGERLTVKALHPRQHFTEPPPRFSEGTLVKELEENGIGRPSTYASILSTILAKAYIHKDKGKLIPTELGFVVSDLLIESFPDLMDVKYTARLEEELDEIEDGKLNWVDALKEFNDKFGERLRAAATEMKNLKAEQTPTGEACEKCGKPMVMRWGRFGKFIACSGYPECKNTKEVEKPGDPPAADDEEVPICEKCGKPFAKKRGRFGMFWACTGYPECKNTRRIPKPGQPAPTPPQMLDEHCPRCGKQLVSRTSRFGPFVSCSGYPDCKFVKGTDTGVRCVREGCGGWIVRKRSRRGAFYACDNYPKCKESFPAQPVPEPCPKCKLPFLLAKVTKEGEREELFCSDKECGHRQPAAAPVAVG
ncbi:MAG: type I DNA topoisomerase [Acidobacteriota bacterium]